MEPKQQENARDHQVLNHDSVFTECVITYLEW